MNLKEFSTMIEKSVRLNAFFQYRHKSPFTLPLSLNILHDLQEACYDDLLALSHELSPEELLLVQKIQDDFDSWITLDMDALLLELTQSKGFKEDWKNSSLEEQRACIYSDPRFYYYGRKILPISSFHAVLRPEDMVYGLHHVPLLYSYLTAKNAHDFFSGKYQALDTPYEAFWIEKMRHKPMQPTYEERLQILANAIMENEWFNHVSWLEWFEIALNDYDPSSTYQRLSDVFARLHPLIMIEKELQPLDGMSLDFSV